jgi:hypothetical protein
MYLDDGNPLPFFPLAINKGIIHIKDHQLHEIKVILKDVYGNKSTLTIPLQGNTPSVELNDLKWDHSDQIKTKLYEKYLKITAPITEGTANHCLLYSNRMKYELIPSYHSNEVAVYLWDMNLGMPDSVNVCDVSMTMNYEVMLPSGVDFNFYNRVFDIRSFRRTLYDTLFLEAEYSPVSDSTSEIFTIGDPLTPLANPIQITFKPTTDYTTSDKYGIYSTRNFKDFSFNGNQWKHNEITITTKNLGSFTILEDTLAPLIKPLRIDHRKVSFMINDNLSGIKEYKAYLNGEWLLMHYDPKQNYIWSETLRPNNPLTGSFKLTVEDNVGNVSEYATQID